MKSKLEFWIEIKGTQAVNVVDPAAQNTTIATTHALTTTNTTENATTIPNIEASSSPVSDTVTLPEVVPIMPVSADLPVEAAQPSVDPSVEPTGVTTEHPADHTAGIIEESTTAMPALPADGTTGLPAGMIHILSFSTT